MTDCFAPFAPPSSDRRVFDRFRLDMPARYLCSGREQDGAILLDVSAAGAAVRTRARPPLGEDIVVYAEVGFRLAGRVVRWFASGFAIVFEANANRLDRILVKMGLRSAEARAASILPAPGEGPRLKHTDGSPLAGAVTAVSVVGVNVESRERPPLGTPIQVGRAEARVTAHTKSGFTAEFDAYWNTSARNAWLPSDRLQGGEGGR